MKSPEAAEAGPTAKVRDVLATVVEACVVLLAVAYVVTGEIPVLFAWELFSTAYIVGGLAIVIWQAHSGRSPDRPGVFGSLSWILPLVASVAGVYSAALALGAQGSASQGDENSLHSVALAVIGIVISWVLLHLGMAQGYQGLQTDSAGEARFEFPATPTPFLLDFLYFSFAIGTAFATSDTRVLSRRVRLLILLHSVIAFFYNAFVIVVAFQVLQELVPQ